MKTIGQLFDGIEHSANRVNFDATVDYIGHDSREIPPTAHPLFFAIRGKHRDANLFANGVRIANKNAVIVSEFNHDGGIKVSNFREAMAIVARRFYNFPDEKMSIIAATGTNGKSTIGFLLRHLLGGCGLLGTIEYDLGGQILPAPNTTPIALDFYKLLQKCEQNGCKNVALEVSSHALDQKRAFDLATDVAIFTNLSHEHLDYHGTLENYFSAKKKLFSGENGPSPRVSLVNVDDGYGLKLFEILKADGKQVYGFGFAKNADFCITQVGRSSLEGSTFTLRHKNWSCEFETKLFGDYNLSNAAAGLAAASILGYDFDQLKPKLATYCGTPGRLEAVPLRTGAVAFIDYAHTPQALKMVLSTLLKQPHRRVISVFGCGGERDRAKRAPMAKIATSLSDHTIVTADNVREEPLEQIFDDMRVGVACPSGAVEFIADRYAAIERALELSQNGDIVLIAGRGHENDQKIGDKVVHFCDGEVLKEINGKP
ncbi:MAG: UDP-N-acetylmuramoyl-L-alanyl-D-glutamate--2,6-diaminopimelate ligase [Puniceicoccales bacterium]|nr:UDP-N-acetylmuramoyl-L-alanyl-D-glutamate--2,6-diaminopimelate ligase [Puniceicoccales bacterium]